jgi:glycosyltransferase involved in cell wall biosynthesis
MNNSGSLKTISPLVSVIVPCYNHGKFLDEAVESFISSSNGVSAEIIIIDDGSTDEGTIIKIEELAQKGYNVHRQKNGGVDKARNTGISLAKGKYILPLDADNKLRTPYFQKAVKIMELDDDVGVVYGDALYFGQKSGVWKNKPFSLQRLLLTNFIDTCALIRKNLLAEVGGYKYAYGYEDWDLWLRICKTKSKFYYLEEICFEYRYLQGSMMDEVLQNKTKSNIALEHIHNQNKDIIDPAAFEEYLLAIFKKSPFGILGKIILKAYLPATYNYFYKKNMVRKYF